MTFYFYLSRCPVCGKTFFGEDKLVAHYSSHDAAEEAAEGIHSHDHETREKRKTSHFLQSGHHLKRHISVSGRN